jgi:hypothetical protein
MPRNPNKRRCSTPGCRAWAVRGLDPPRCVAHTRAQAGPRPGAPPPVRRPAAPPADPDHPVHGFYAPVFTRQEVVDLVAGAGDPSLDAEIAIARVGLRRVLRMLHTGLAPDSGADPAGASAGSAPRPLTVLDYARLAALAFRGVSVVARLLCARQALGGPLSDLLPPGVAEALDELGRDLPVEL